jgi:hypothetical protein
LTSDEARDAIALVFAALDDDDHRFVEVLAPYRRGCPVGLIAQLATLACHGRDEDELRAELLELSLAYARTPQG